MKSSIQQYMDILNRKHVFSRRLTSVLCILSLLVTVSVSALLTMPGLTASYDPASTGGITELVTDAPTYDAWLDYYKISTGSNLSFTTEYAGSVWTDKSVLTSFTENNVTITADENNMLGVLSAVGSSMAITGRIYTPTDVMLILDLSSSMYKNGNTYTSGNLKNLVQAVNNSIATLLSLNDYNRIGVTLYWGGNNVSQTMGSTLNHGMVLLPLNRYIRKSDKSYLSFTTSDGYKVSANAQVDNGNGTGEVITRSYENLPSVAGTYAQLGIQNARNEFLRIADDDTYITMNGEKIIRQPVFIFMSDGRPTASHSSFSTLTGNVMNDKTMAEWGLNSEKNRTSDASDFVFQLTSSYSKLVVGEHYGAKPLFYTLGLGVTNVSLNVMDPIGSESQKSSGELTDQRTITEFWSKLIENHSVEFNVKWNTHTTTNDWGTLYDKKMTVNSVNVQMKNGSTMQFPSDISQMDYVDRYFPASNASALSGAFESIVNEIILKSIYAPTKTASNRENTSGEVSFVDQIGDYMEVKKINGILLGGTLYTGLGFSQTLANADRDLGTMGNATEFGMAFWNNIIEQLGLDHVYRTTDDDGNTFGTSVEVVSKTEELIQQAYGAGQIAYNAETGTCSNYIGWYANAEDEYLGFWNDRTQNQPPGGATQCIKTYFFQKELTGQEDQTMKTDLMYITVWIKEEIQTGVQTVVFSIPASLLPTLKYFVKLDVDGKLESVHLGSVNEDTVLENVTIDIQPIRLVYEVGLREDIKANNLLDKVSNDYLEKNTKDGIVYFYTNEWERTRGEDGRYTGYGKENTYSYFYPSRFNDRYYYIEDTDIYFLDETAGNYIQCTANNYSELSPGDKLYTQHPDYLRNGSSIAEGVYYMPLGDNAMKSALKRTDGTWYIPAGTQHSLETNDVSQYFRMKMPSADGTIPANATGTLSIRNAPTIDNIPDRSTEYLLAATLGNNGRIAMEPMGQSVQKVLENEDGSAYIAESTQTFRFLLHEGAQLSEYSSWEEVSAQLSGRKATVLSLTVMEGTSQSNVVELKDLTEYTYSNGWAPKAEETPKWGCTYGGTYTLVELDPGGRYVAPEPLEFKYGISEDGSAATATVTAGNQFVPWRLELSKYDGNLEDAHPVSGALFGLYSLNQADQMAEPPAGCDAVKTVGEQTWYLVETKVTADTGQIIWDALVRDQYLVYELRVPDGYMQPTDETTLYKTVVRPDNNVLTVRFTNTPGAVLPSTGGPGTTAYQFIGILLMLASIVLMMVYYHSQRKGEQKRQ